MNEQLLEKAIELLSSKAVAAGIPGAIGLIGVAKALEGQYEVAIWCFAGAAGVGALIWIGKRLAPTLNKFVDWGIGEAERSLLEGWSALRSDFEGQYLKQQARLCEEFISEGFNPDRTTIPLLEEVFVPLDLSGAVSSGVIAVNPSKPDRILTSEHLKIWDLLARSRRDRKFRQMSILAKGGMGKTTLLRHVALIYGQRKERRYKTPKLIPVLLRLRDYIDPLTQTQPPSLPDLITSYHVPNLSKNQPLTPPARWATTILNEGRALVMLDGFDEVPEDRRGQVSQWISAQMREYSESVFIVTSRPAGYKDYTAQRPAVPIFVNEFNEKQQKDFIEKWYLCQERCCRSEKQRRQAREVATARSKQLLDQLKEREEELGKLAKNPLLLNMMVTFHRFNPEQELPRQRLELYRGICKLQLDDRPRARGIRMLLSFENSCLVLQTIASGLTGAKRTTVKRQPLLDF